MEQKVSRTGALEAICGEGLSLHRAGRLDEARRRYETVLEIDPENFDALHLLGALNLQAGQPEAGLELIERAIAIRPDALMAYANLANALNNLGRHEEALAICDRAIALTPNDASAHFRRGVTLRALRRASEAVASLDCAIALKPDFADAHWKRGAALVDLARFDEALSGYERAVALKPDHVEALSDMVVPLQQLQRPQEAAAAAERAIAIRPDHAMAHNNLGAAHYQSRRLEEALVSFDRAIELKPDYAAAHANKGAALYELRRFDEAMTSFDRAIAVSPELADAHNQQAMCRLAMGDFTRGWPQYEWRWRTPPYARVRRHQDKPLWLGREALEGQTILLHGEQGFGDTLQFCRYVTEVAARGATVILEVQPGLERLLARLEGVAQVARRGAALAPCHLQTPLLSLPLALGKFEPDPGRGPYLSAYPQDVAAWRDRLGTSEKRRIGLCWAGSPGSDQLAAALVDKRRSLPLEAFAPLAGVEGVEIYSLQKGPPAAQLSESLARGWEGPPILDLTAELGDFADTAALIANLDLVITCDTAIAHLAGGLGKPVWILNRFDACWRWMAGREDSPWYLSARLFRQATPGDWAGVIERVTGELSREPAVSG